MREPTRQRLILPLFFVLLGALPAVRAARCEAAGAAAERPSDLSAEAAYQFALAKLYADESAFDDALGAFHKTIELDPSDPYPHLELAKFHAYLARISRGHDAGLRHLEEAAAEALEARNLAPANNDVLRTYGQVELYLSDQDPGALSRARDAFEAVRRSSDADLQTLSSLGQIYLSQNQPERAVEVLEEAVHQRPAHRMINALLVDALLAAGKPDEAEQVLARMVTEDPGSLDNRLKLVELLSQSGAHARAVAALREAPPEDLANSRVRRWLAQELHLAGDNEAALEALQSLVEENPDEPQLHRLRVAVLTSLGRYDEAVAELRGVLADADSKERRPGDELLLCRLLERVGRGDEAVHRLRDLAAAAAEEDRQEVRITLAGVLERQGRREEAAAVLRDELELERADADTAPLAARALAGLLQRDGKVEEAVALLERQADRLAAEEQGEAARGLRLLRLTILAESGAWERLAELATPLAEPTDEAGIAARLYYARALDHLGRVDEGLAALTVETSDEGVRRRLAAERVAMLFRNGRDPEGDALLAQWTGPEATASDLFFVAQAYQRAGRYGAAIPVAERVIASQPDSSQALFLLAAACERHGETRRAAEVFEKLLALSPDYAPALNYLGYMWAEQGEHLDRALELVRRAVAIEPDNGAYVDSLGWTYFQLGLYEEARGHLEWAARLIPDDPTIFEHLGDLYLALKDSGQARRYYKQAVDLAGDNLDAVRQKLERLGGQGL